jgi:hypothetical protein
MRSRETHAVAVDKMVDIRGSLARHDVKRRARGLNRSAWCEGPLSWRRSRAFGSAAMLTRDVFSIQSSTLQARPACKCVCGRGHAAAHGGRPQAS